MALAFANVSSEESTGLVLSFLNLFLISGMGATQFRVKNKIILTFIQSLTVKRPVHQSWRIRVFFGCHGLTLTLRRLKKHGPQAPDVPDLAQTIKPWSDFIELIIWKNIWSFETQFFILSTIKNTGQVFRVTPPSPFSPDLAQRARGPLQSSGAGQLKNWSLDKKKSDPSEACSNLTSWSLLAWGFW